MNLSSRRHFLNKSVGIGVGVALSSRGFAANETIRVACIGVRGQGGSLLRTFAAQPDVVVTHICDIDESVRTTRGLETEKATKRMPKLVVDYRTVLDNKDIDAVVIGTPDHWHALPTIHACMAKKDVYVEKPDGHNINEGKAMVAAARKYERMVQLGTQARSAGWLKEARAFVAGGGIGKVIVGKAWETDRQRPVPPVKDSAPPKGVDYNLWLGAAAERPFNRNRFHGSWRWYFDFGCGDLGNDGVHRLDYCRYVMGLETLPTAVSASGGKFFFDDDQEWPDTMLITYDYPGRIMTYEMRIWSKPKLHGITEGAAIHGDEGWVLVSNTGWKAYDGAGKEIKAGSGSNALNEHVRNFLEAVKSRKRDSLNQEIASGHVSSVLCHAGNIAWRTGKKLKLDAKSETFDDAEANRYVGRTARKGFELPQV